MVSCHVGLRWSAWLPFWGTKSKPKTDVVASIWRRCRKRMLCAEARMTIPDLNLGHLLINIPHIVTWSWCLQYIPSPILPYSHQLHRCPQFLIYQWISNSTQITNASEWLLLLPSSMLLDLSDYRSCSWSGNQTFRSYFVDSRNVMTLKRNCKAPS